MPEPAERIAEIARMVGRMLRESPFPHRIIRWTLNDGTYIEAKKISHKIQKVYWSKAGDAWLEPHTRRSG